MSNGWSLFFAAAGLVVNGVGIGFIAIQVTLARRTEKRELTRGRKESTTDAYSSTQEHRAALRKELPDDWDGRDVAAFLERVAAGDAAAASTLKEYLGHLETLSVGVASGVYDIEVMDSLCGPRLINTVRHYRSFIVTRRKEIGYDGYCAELLWLSNELERRDYSRAPYVSLAQRNHADAYRYRDEPGLNPATTSLTALTAAEPAGRAAVSSE